MKHTSGQLKKVLAYILAILLLAGGIFLAVCFIRFGIRIKPWEKTGETEETAAAEETLRPEEGDGREPEEAGEWDSPAENRPAAGEIFSGKKEETGENACGEEETQTPEAYEPPDLMLASDLHYLSPSAHDDGSAFRKMVAADDGKPSQYSEEMTDALLAEAVRARPSALILSGDLTHNGERQGHLELADKLRRVQGAGVPVLVIPGNHDIKNPMAAVYFGDEKQAAENLDSGEEFYEIYREFGYDGAISRDSASLSYVYVLDDTHWVMMLDSCQYEDKNHVGGRIREETLAWMEEQLSLAAEKEIFVLPVAHHNLLSESRLYKTECTLENGGQVTELLEKYEIPLYVSGHLHAQRIKKHREEPGAEDHVYGVTEIVLGPYSIPPCQYGYLRWDDENRLAFETREADVASLAAASGGGDEILLQFDQKGTELVRQTIRDQLSKTRFAVPEGAAELMKNLYANLYVDYCAGYPIDRKSVTSTRGYGMWLRAAPDSKYVKEMEEMMEDASVSHRQWTQK